jgi:hypothetical protein
LRTQIYDLAESPDGQNIVLRKEVCCAGDIWSQKAGQSLDAATILAPSHAAEWWSLGQPRLFYVDTSSTGFKALPATAPKPVYFLDWRTR